MNISDGEFMAMRMGNQRVSAVAAEANGIIHQCNATIRAQRQTIADLRAANADLAARLAEYDRAAELERGAEIMVQARALRARREQRAN